MKYSRSIVVGLSYKLSEDKLFFGECGGGGSKSKPARLQPWTRHLPTSSIPPTPFQISYRHVLSQSEMATRSEQQQQHLLSKRAWDMALQPLKALPMNMSVIYPGRGVAMIYAFTKY